MDVWTGLGQEEVAPEFKLTHQIMNKRFASVLWIIHLNDLFLDTTSLTQTIWTPNSSSWVQRRDAWWKSDMWAGSHILLQCGTINIILQVIGIIIIWLSHNYYRAGVLMWSQTLSSWVTYFTRTRMVASSGCSMTATSSSFPVEMPTPKAILLSLRKGSTLLSCRYMYRVALSPGSLIFFNCARLEGESCMYITWMMSLVEPRKALLARLFLSHFIGFFLWFQTSVYQEEYARKLWPTLIFSCSWSLWAILPFRSLVVGEIREPGGIVLGWMCRVHCENWLWVLPSVTNLEIVFCKTAHKIAISMWSSIFQIRHPTMSSLEQLKDMGILLEFKLPTAITLDAGSSRVDVFSPSSKFSSRSVAPGKLTTVFVSSLPDDK